MWHYVQTRLKTCPYYNIHNKQLLSIIQDPPNVDAKYWRSHPTRAVLIQLHQCGTGAGLGQSVPLQHWTSHTGPRNIILVVQRKPQDPYRTHTAASVWHRFRSIRTLEIAYRSQKHIICAVVLYVQEVVTLQKKYLIYLHQKMRFTPFINYYDTLG